MPTLTAIEQEIQSVLMSADELDVEQLPAVDQYLTDLAIQEAEKVDGISYIVRKRAAEIDWLKDEEARIRGKRISMEKRMEEFKDFLKGTMRTHGLKKVKGNKATIWLKEVDAVVVDNLSDIPDHLKQMRIDVVPDKMAIKKALDNGECPGAHIEKRMTINIR